MKFTKLKNGKYVVNGVTTYEEVIIKLNLFNENNFDTKKIMEENKYYELYYKALNYIKRGMKTKKQVLDFINNTDIVNKLCKEGYIDDLRYTRAFIHDKLLFTDYGPLKLKLKLYYLGVDKNIIEEEINKIDNEIFNKKIIKLINKNKKLNYIINQGYSYEDIKKATNDC